MFLRLSLFLMTFIILRHTGKVLCTVYQHWQFGNLFDVVPISRLRLWVWGKKMEEINFHLRRRSRVRTINVLYDCWYWPWSPGWGSDYQVSSLLRYSFFPFSYCTLWKEVSILTPHLSPQLLLGQSIYINYLELLYTGDLSVLSDFNTLFNHLFISLCIHEYLFYTLGYNLIWLYSVWSNYSSIGHWELFQLSSKPLW